ncbi:MAG: type III-B CRISPR module-associated Cmr3 family protein [Myxococcales bacterium]|nr:type III-B CRISPR module-associated protein Cmr3 [Myxococcota bacterium]MDW8283872.1 type III-B CRISPR module-associated Cmr3 family protein [Myxococcales bacterium]
MTTTTCVALVPRDGLFCKDGRGWHTSTSGRGHGLDWPWPSTILGVLRTAWGRSEEERCGAVLGPDEWRRCTAAVRLGRTLVLRRAHGRPWDFADTVWPVPADALWLDGHTRVYRLTPQPSAVPTLGRDDDEAREALWRPQLEERGKPLPPPRWWNSEDFVAWLAGRPVDVRAREQVLGTVWRVQVHVGILPEQLTADEGVLFAHDVLETLERGAEWAIGAEVTLADGALSGVATVGADARLAWIEPLPAELFAPPAPLLAAFNRPSQGLRIVAVTPLCCDKGWVPDGFAANGNQYTGRLPGVDAELVLRAAFVPRPIHVSGWDMAAGTPKPTSRMVAPGSVYFFERTDGKPFGEADARSLWLAVLGRRTDEGFGRIVPGTWSPARSTP